MMPLLSVAGDLKPLCCHFRLQPALKTHGLPSPPPLSPCPAVEPTRPVAQAVATETKKLERVKVPLELEDGELPLNTFSPKKPFKASMTL